VLRSKENDFQTLASAVTVVLSLPKSYTEKKKPPEGGFSNTNLIVDQAANTGSILRQIVFDIDLRVDMTRWLLFRENSNSASLTFLRSSCSSLN
jgi:hypothetical protein